MLFVELALIRWAGANVVHLSYFSNHPAGPLLHRRETTGLPEWVTLPAVFLLTAVTMAGIGQITADLFRLLPSLDADRYDLLGSITGSLSFAVLSWLRAPSIVWGVLAAAAVLVLGGRRNTLRYGIPLTAMVAALFLETTSGISGRPTTGSNSNPRRPPPGPGPSPLTRPPRSARTCWARDRGRDRVPRLVRGYQALFLVDAALYLGAFVAMRFAGREPAVT
jgi:hypothetical protein